jgi:hypothetical protein
LILYGPGAFPLTVAQTQPQQRQGIQRRNLKKGPRRLKKSVEQLDREMETYMADAPRISEDDVSAAVSAGLAMQQ